MCEDLLVWIIFFVQRFCQQLLIFFAYMHKSLGHFLWAYRPRKASICKMLCSSTVFFVFSKRNFSNNFSIVFNNIRFCFFIFLLVIVSLIPAVALLFSSLSKNSWTFVFNLDVKFPLFTLFVFFQLQHKSFIPLCMHLHFFIILPLIISSRLFFV